MNPETRLGAFVLPEYAVGKRAALVLISTAVGDGAILVGRQLTPCDGNVSHGEATARISHKTSVLAHIDDDRLGSTRPCLSRR